MAKRQINEEEKQQVVEMQRESDGSLRCFISGEIINLETDEIEYDHVEPYSKNGETSVSRTHLKNSF